MGTVQKVCNLDEALKCFTLRGKVEQMVNESSGKKTSPSVSSCKLSFELEVCLIPIAAGCSSSYQQPIVGILRKRLTGDTWCYKKVCEEVLALAAKDL